MSRFRCLALETGVRPSSLAACNGDRSFQMLLPDGSGVAAGLFEAIDQVLAEVGLRLDELDCIAFGRGPGAFTGLRVAAAAAQGLATGLGIRLCAVSSLAALAQDAFESAVCSGQGEFGALPEVADGPASRGDIRVAGTRIAPALSAGRGEMYLGWYRIGESGLVMAQADDWLAPEARYVLPGTERFTAAGKVWSENAGLQTANAGRIIGVADSATPSAGAVLRLAKPEHAEGHLLQPDDAQPVYLRDALGSS